MQRLPQLQVSLGRSHSCSLNRRVNLYEHLRREESAPHTQPNMDMSNSQMLESFQSTLRQGFQQQADMFNQRFTRQDEAFAKHTSEVNSGFSTVFSQLRETNDQVRVLTHNDHHTQERVHSLEHATKSLSNQLEQISVSPSLPSSVSNDQLLWISHVKSDSANADAIAGYIFVKPLSESHSWNTSSIAATLQIPLNKIVEREKKGIFRIIAGGTGREGAIAGNNFLNVKKAPFSQGPVNCP